MDEHIIYAAGFTQAMSHCIQKLKHEGFTIVSEPNPQVTHLLLPVPSFTPDGMITGGGNLATLLTLLPKDIVVIGGNLDRPELDYYTTIDLLQDEAYLAQNAQITAHCAIKLAMNQLPVILDDCPVLLAMLNQMNISFNHTSDDVASWKLDILIKPSDYKSLLTQ